LSARVLSCSIKPSNITLHEQAPIAAAFFLCLLLTVVRVMSTMHPLKEFEVSLNPTRRARIICVAIVSTLGTVMYASAAHADEGVTWCAPHDAPIVLAKRPAAAASYAPHHALIHRHRVPAMLRKPAPQVKCTPATLPALMLPPGVPAVADAAEPIVGGVIPPVYPAIPAAYAEDPVVGGAIPPVALATPAADAAEPVVGGVIPPVALATPAAAEAAAPVVGGAVAPVSTVTPEGAMAAAAVAVPVAAVPIGMLAAYIGLCVVGHACGGSSGTVGGNSIATTGTTGTH